MYEFVGGMAVIKSTVNHLFSFDTILIWLIINKIFFLHKLIA